jgi:hypothetical protein
VGSSRISILEERKKKIAREEYVTVILLPRLNIIMRVIASIMMKFATGIALKVRISNS